MILSLFSRSACQSRVGGMRKVQDEGKWYDGEVISVNTKKQTIHIKFEDGDEDTDLAWKHVVLENGKIRVTWRTRARDRWKSELATHTHQHVYPDQEKLLLRFRLSQDSSSAKISVFLDAA